MYLHAALMDKSVIQLLGVKDLHSTYNAEVQQILDRFRCHHKGCGQKLDTDQKIQKSGCLGRTGH